MRDDVDAWRSLPPCDHGALRSIGFWLARSPSARVRDDAVPARSSGDVDDHHTGVVDALLAWSQR